MGCRRGVHPSARATSGFSDVMEGAALRDDAAIRQDLEISARFEGDGFCFGPRTNESNVVHTAVTFGFTCGIQSTPA